jgi:hypothetical protein
LVSEASSTRVFVRPSKARSVAWMLLIKSEAGRPFPETSAAQIR